MLRCGSASLPLSLPLFPRILGIHLSHWRSVCPCFDLQTREDGTSFCLTFAGSRRSCRRPASRFFAVCNIFRTGMYFYGALRRTACRTLCRVLAAFPVEPYSLLCPDEGHPELWHAPQQDTRRVPSLRQDDVPRAEGRLLVVRFPQCEDPRVYVRLACNLRPCVSHVQRALANVAVGC